MNGCADSHDRPRRKIRKAALAFVLSTFLIYFYTSKKKTCVSTGTSENSFLSFWIGSSSRNSAIVADESTVWKLRKLKNFQALTHDLLLRHKLLIPKKIPEVEDFMLEARLQPEYWKTALPSIFYLSG